MITCTEVTFKVKSFLSPVKLTELIIYLVIQIVIQAGKEHSIKCVCFRERIN